MIQIEAPDGSIVEFPEGTADETIKSVMAKSFPAQQAQPNQQPDQRWGWQKALDDYGLQTMKDFSTGVMRGNIPFADEITAAAMTPFGMVKRAVTGDDAGKGIMQRASDSYSDALSFNRKTDADAYSRSPVANTLGQIAGGINTAGALAKGGVTLLNPSNPTMGNMALRGASEGALYSGIYGFGEGEGLEDRLKKMATSSMWGFGTGLLSGAVAGKLTQRAAEKTIPTADAIRSQANAAYKAAEDAGVVFNPKNYATFYDDVFSAASQKGLNQTLTPNSVAALKSLEELKGIPLTLQSLETQRKVLNNAAALAARSGNKADTAIANSAIRRLDDFVSNNTNVLMSGADPTKAVEALKSARADWRRANASDTITNILDDLAPLRAQNYSQSGYDNALRTEFTQLLRNKTKMRFFTPAEQEQIRKVVDGSIAEKGLRLIGKLAPRSSMSLMPSLATGLATGSAIPTAAMVAAGEIGKQGAMMMRSNNARIVDLLARSGGKMPTGNISQAQKLIIDSLLSGQRALVGNNQQVPAR